MYEIIAVSQLANALRYEVSEMFVSGRLAIQIHRVMTKKRSLQEWRTLYRNIFDLLQTQYDIVIFDDSDCVHICCFDANQEIFQGSRRNRKPLSASDLRNNRICNS